MLRLGLATLGLVLSAGWFAMLAGSAAATDGDGKVEHPVVYDTEPAAKAQDAGNAQRVPHPVVYDNAAAPGQQSRPADYYERPPHPVVEVTDEPAPAVPSAPGGAQPATAGDGARVEDIAAEPDNPDYDPGETAGEPAGSDTAAPVILHTEEAQSEAAKELAALLDGDGPRELDEISVNALKAFYDGRRFEPLWVGKTGLTKSGARIVEALRTADEWGLDASRFDVPDIAEARADGPVMDPARQADLELSVAGNALVYASHARGGRILEPSKQLSSYLDRTPQLKDPMVVLKDLEAAADPSAVLQGLHPSHPQFEQLRQKYLALLAARDEAKVITLPPGPLLREGVRHPHVALLRERLEIPATAAEDNSPFDGELFDANVAEHVRSYQKENGLSADGLVGNATRRALNDVDLPSPEKLRANMEQWRWMPDDLGDIHVWVNVPEFKFRVIKDGRVIHSERIIIGELSKQTPVFSDEIETLYFHPKWHVPQSIKVNELYPSLARGGGYFRKQGLRIAYNGRPVNPYAIDWSSADIRRYHVYQPPGPSNVLGLVKFTFPNKHQVYMHDTPTKHLFDKKVRTFSHGCMRVRNPLQFAEVLLEAANGMGQDEVEAIVNGPVVETPVKLDKKVPVHVTYFTAWVDEDGNEQTARDVYGHEKRIMLALQGRFSEIAVGRDHLAPVKLKPRQSYTGTTAVEVFFNNLFGGF